MRQPFGAVVPWWQASSHLPPLKALANLPRAHARPPRASASSAAPAPLCGHFRAGHLRPYVRSTHLRPAQRDLNLRCTQLSLPERLCRLLLRRLPGTTGSSRRSAASRTSITSCPSHKPLLSLKVLSPLSALIPAPLRITMCFIIFHY